MPTDPVKPCCAYSDAGLCFVLVSSVMLHQGPDFILFALKRSLEHVADQLVDGSQMRARYRGLALKLEAVIAAGEDVRREPTKLN